MSRVFYLPSFIKQTEKLRHPQAEQAEEALVQFHRFVRTGEKSEGLGFKKIAHDLYEIRVDLRTRIVMQKIGEDYYLALYGDHTAIERFLKRQ